MKIKQTYSASLFPVTADLNKKNYLEPTEAANTTRERIIRTAVIELIGIEANELPFVELLDLVSVVETLCVKGENVTFEIETI